MSAASCGRLFAQFQVILKCIESYCGQQYSLSQDKF